TQLLVHFAVPAICDLALPFIPINWKLLLVRHREDPAKEGDALRRKRPESSGKEKVVTKKRREPQIKAEIKKGQGEIKEKPGKIKEEPVEIKEEQGEIKEKPGKVKEEPVEIKEEQGEVKKKPREIEEEPVENKKESGEIKEPGESTVSDKVILCPVHVSCCSASVWRIESFPVELE
uniref:Uncharacterized protein n=1 Tax=Terrapene triunguis TaxID=2587831 RepID=A0A674JFP3_9SAUR